jgi:microcystin-dependent protein
MSPPYEITFIPSVGTDLTETDITNTLNNYTGYKEARYFFLQVETINERIGIAEIEIYDPLGNNIALDTITPPTSWLSLGNLVNGDYDSNDIAQQTGVAGERTWVGIDLGSEQKIAGIRVYSRNGRYGTGANANRMFPYRIYLYDESEYAGRTFANGGNSSSSTTTGPIDYDIYSVTSDTTKSNGATKMITINAGSAGNSGTQRHVFYHGIHAQIGTTDNPVTIIPESFYQNNAITSYGSTHVRNTGITINNEDAFSLPVGSVIIWLSETPPTANYLYCDGSSFAASDYPHLYTIIGTSYGGTSTDPLLPDLRDRSPIGGEHHTSGEMRDTLDYTPNTVDATTKTGGSNTLNPNQLIHTHQVTSTTNKAIYNSESAKNANKGAGASVHIPNNQYTSDDYKKFGETPESAYMPPYNRVNYIIYAGYKTSSSDNFI